MDNLVIFRNETSKYLNSIVAKVEKTMNYFSELSVKETQKRFTDSTNGNGNKFKMGFQFPFLIIFCFCFFVDATMCLTDTMRRITEKEASVSSASVLAEVKRRNCNIHLSILSRLFVSCY